jgi:hypothetical protein
MIRVPSGPDGARWSTAYQAVTRVSDGLSRPLLPSARRDIADAVIAELGAAGHLAPLDPQNGEDR